MRTSILFPSPSELRALAEGSLTLSVIPFKPQPTPWGKTGYCGGIRTWNWIPHERGEQYTDAGFIMKSPYGVGDRLLFKETWACGVDADGEPKTFYASTDKPSVGMLFPGRAAIARWRPANHMPSHFVRYRREIVRVEARRLHRIHDSEMAQAGAIAFGGMSAAGFKHSASFVETWNRKWGKKPGLCWDADPYVWMIGHKEVMA